MSWTPLQVAQIKRNRHRRIKLSVLTTIKQDAEDVKAFIQKVAVDAPAAFTKVVNDEKAITQVIEAFVPGSTAAITAANAVLTVVEAAIEAAGSAAAANGVNVSLDKVIVASVQSVIAGVKAAV
jgi:hypothetical protein